MREQLYRGGPGPLDGRRLGKAAPRPKGKAVHIGERVLIAQILKLDGDWVEFVVLGGSIASEKSGWKVSPVAAGTEVSRKRQTVEKGKPERLLWSDETVRALLVARSLTDTPPASEEAD